MAIEENYEQHWLVAKRESWKVAFFLSVVIFFTSSTIRSSRRRAWANYAWSAGVEDACFSKSRFGYHSLFDEIKSADNAETALLWKWILNRNRNIKTTRFNSLNPFFLLPFSFWLQWFHILPPHLQKSWARAIKKPKGYYEVYDVELG